MMEVCIPNGKSSKVVVTLAIENLRDPRVDFE